MSDELIDTQDLVIGDCFKNYKELCTALKQPVYAGNQKKKQLENFKRFFEFEKVGNKFYITKILNEPKEKEYNYPPNTVYIRHIEIILLQFLSKQKGYQVDMPSQYLWLELGIINRDFIDMQDKKEELVEMHEQMRMFYVNDFYKRCRLKFLKIVDSSLENLEKRRLIRYSKVYKVKYPDEFFAETANLIEEVAILKTEREILDEFGFDKINEVYLKNKSAEFYKKRNEKLSELLGCTAVYDYLHIVYDPGNAEKAIEKYQNISRDEVKTEKIKLNDKIVSSVDKQAKDRQENKGINNKEIEEKVDEAKVNGEKPPFYYYESYAEMQYLLSDKLLRIK